MSELPDADTNPECSRTGFVAVARIRHHRVGCGCTPSLCENARG